MGRRWVLQHHNDPKQTARATKERLNKKHMEVLERPRQSPDLSPRKPVKRAEGLSVKRNGPKSPLSCERHLLTNYKKHLNTVLANKGFSPEC